MNTPRYAYYNSSRRGADIDEKFVYIGVGFILTILIAMLTYGIVIACTM